MKKLYTFLVKNWKTTIIGVATSILTYLVSNETITSGQFEMILGILVAIGYLLTKDADKSISDKELNEKIENQLFDNTPLDETK